MPTYKLTITQGSEKAVSGYYLYGYTGSDAVATDPKPDTTDASEVSINSTPKIGYKRTQDATIAIKVLDKGSKLELGTYYLDTDNKTFSTEQPTTQAPQAAGGAAPGADAAKKIDSGEVVAALSGVITHIKLIADTYTDPAFSQDVVKAMDGYYAGGLVDNAQAYDPKNKPTMPFSGDAGLEAVAHFQEPDESVDPTGVVAKIKELAKNNPNFREFLVGGSMGTIGVSAASLKQTYENFKAMLSDYFPFLVKPYGEAVAELKTPAERTSGGVMTGFKGLALTDAEITAGQNQIFGMLDEIEGFVKNPKKIADANIPGAPSLDTGQIASLSATLQKSDFGTSNAGKDQRFKAEVLDAITKIKSFQSIGELTPFTDRPGVGTTLVSEADNKAASDEIANLIKSVSVPYLNDRLSKPDNSAALKFLYMGTSGDLAPGDQQVGVYDNVMNFAALFGFKGDLEKMLKSASVSPDNKAVSLTTGTPQTASRPSAEGVPAGQGSAAGEGGTPVGTAPATQPGTPGAGASAGGTAVSSDSPSSTGGSEQPGAAAEVTDIAVAAVRILNARPVAVQVFMDFGPPRSGDIPQPQSLQWTIDPAYFGGYQLQINDSQRATIAQYKNQQVILRVSATPLTGGRPVEVKQPLPIRTYRLPDQAELVPIKTFTFGRLTGTQSVSPEPAAQGGARDFSKRVAEVPCFFYKADGGVSGPTGDTVGVNSTASGRTYRFDFPEGFLVPIRIKFDSAKNPKTAAKLDKLRAEQGLLQESKGKILKEGGVPHWIFLKRRGALDSGRGGAGGGADESADADAADGLRVNIAVKTIVISTTDKLRVVGNTGNPWDASSFKAAFYPGKGAQFDKNEFPDAGLILCDDDFGIFSGLDRGAVMTAMYRVLFTDRAPASSAYKLMGLQRWADDIRVIGSNPEVSATARRKPDNLFASA